MTYSSIRKVNVPAETDLDVKQFYPNPAGNKSEIEIYSQQTKQVQFKILNNIGQEIKLISKDLLKGNNFITLSTDDLPSGSYFVEIKVDQNYFTRRLLIEK